MRWQPIKAEVQHIPGPEAMEFNDPSYHLCQGDCEIVYETYQPFSLGWFYLKGWITKEVYEGATLGQFIWKEIRK